MDRRKILRWLGFLGLGFLILVGILILWLWSKHEPRPSGEAGPEAEQLARDMMTAVKHEAWMKTGAVQWTFRGKNKHLWDRQRHWARVEWDTTRVWLDLHRKTGVAEVDGQRVEGQQRQTLLETAWAYWANDSFWLNPVAKLFDQGTRREKVKGEGDRSRLLVTYDQGGVTPGDAYLWTIGANGLPEQWEMWVSIIPIGGMDISWDGWIELKTGALVSTLHETPLGDLQLSEVAGAETLAELVPGKDPFTVLVNGK